MITQTNREVQLEKLLKQAAKHLRMTRGYKFEMGISDSTLLKKIDKILTEEQT